MQYIDNLLFLLIAGAAFYFVAIQIKAVVANVKLGRPDERKDNFSERFNRMLLVAFGQQKMFKKPMPAILHGFVYVGFLVINLELIEILIDGIFGTHRALGVFGFLYDALMAVNEILGFLVIVACIILLYRRNVLKIKRFSGIEMKNANFVDANIILWTEIVLMFALFSFNIADVSLACIQQEELAGTFPISNLLCCKLGTNITFLTIIRTVGWWIHIVGVFLFLNYVPRSKHFHIMAAFPNVFFSKLIPPGHFNSLEQITHEVKAAFDPSYQVPVMENQPKRFGAVDVTDISWKNLLDSYSCTECGRCSEVCPANITGKKLSPRKIIMDTRDRLEEIQKYKLVADENGVIIPSDKNLAGAEEAYQHTLLGENYVSNEELWACTTCNACVEACPVTIDHVSTIIDLRRFLVMEKSEIPDSWARMFSNIENNGAPWAVPAATRFDWAMDIEMPV